jgi:chemotaxis protein CheZ
MNPLALVTIAPVPPAKMDYEAVYAALMRSERGRWFLDEYARRNRSADTRLVLDAIERLAASVRGNEADQARHALRSELLQMTEAIVRARAEVTEINPTPGAPSAAPGGGAPPDIFAAAERLQDVAWTMRERGFDLATCDEIGAVAASIIDASALHDPTGRRAQKLAEVLHDLEQRINGMLAMTVADGGHPSAGERARTPDPAPRPDPPATAPCPPDPQPGPATRVDPLAALKAMSDEERIALFT